MFKRLVGCVVGVALSLSVAPHAFATPDVVAHQGYGHSTAYSYASAARTGATLEGDLQLTKDNKVVISHDARLPRKCRGKMLIKKLKWSQIRSCDRNIIRLETMATIANNYNVDISLEFKKNGGKKWTKKKMKKVYRILASKGMLRHTNMYSFNYGYIVKWRKIDKRRYTKTGLNVNTRSGLNVSRIKKAGGRVTVRMDLVDANKVRYLQSNGIYVSVYTVRNQAQLARVKAMNPNAIVTDIRI